MKTPILIALAATVSLAHASRLPVTQPPAVATPV
jgi:hypothetical protein